MKAVVEFGRPLIALPEGAPCGVSGSFTCESASKAAWLASQLRHVMSGRLESEPDLTGFLVARDKPRVTWWERDQSFWITVSVLDGESRGPYYALADREAKEARERK
jgi:hypothetical protein